MSVSPRTIRRLIPLLPISLATGLLAWIEAEPPAIRPNPEVQMSADADCAVLVVTTHGGMVPVSSVVELYGDGRVVGRSIPGSGGSGSSTFESRIPRAELVRLVTDLANSNALERGWEILPTVRAARSVTDAGAIFIEVRLTRYRERMVKPNRSIHFRFGGYALHNAVEKLPELPELAAIGRVLDRVEELIKPHRTSAEARQARRPEVNPQAQ